VAPDEPVGARDGADDFPAHVLVGHLCFILQWCARKLLRPDIQTDAAGFAVDIYAFASLR